MTRGSTLLLGGIVAIALAVRLWGITFGLPYDLTADEPHQIVQALKIGTSQGGPLVRMWHTVGKGGLDYLLFFEYGVLFAVWRVMGRIHSTREFALLYLTDPAAFYLVGRVTVAALGAATSLAVFHVGRRLYDTRIALGAAFLAAVAYFHSASSHLINVHIPMVFALWSGIAAYVSYEASGERRRLVAAGLLCGAAIALAYSAAVGFLMVIFAVLFMTRRPGAPAARYQDGLLLAGAALVSVALMSPDLFTGAAVLLQNFAAASAQQVDTRGAIDAVTILRQQDWSGFVGLLLKPDAVMITLGAIAGTLVGLLRREPWTMLLSATTAIAVAIVSASNRGLNEAYLLPMTPALWLLCSRGIAALSVERRWLNAAGILAVGAVSLFFTTRDDLMLWTPDTRVLAKQWIEQHVPPGSKILMDGMRFRYVQSAPLNADGATVARRLADLEQSELTLSDTMLSLYREAAARVQGPTYELHSTVYGLEVEPLDEYVRLGFDYIVVSSFNEKRYQSADAAARHPNSVRFYRDIRTDPRFEVVYAIGPEMWKQVGPAITVYRVIAASAFRPATTAS